MTSRAVLFVLFAVGIWAQLAASTFSRQSNSQARARVTFLYAGVAHAETTFSGNSTKADRSKAIALLKQSPLLEPTMGVVSQARYVRDSKKLLRSVGFAGVSRITTATDATKALEALLQGDVIEAKVSSFPRHVTVRYRRLVDVPGTEQDVTTDAVLRLPPALYLFTGISPTSTDSVTRRISCATNCTIVFDFRRARK